MTGITPPAFTRSGRCVDCPPDHALRILHGNAPLATLHVNDEADHHNHEDDQPNHQDRRDRAPGSVLRFFKKVFHAARQTNNDAGKDQQRHAVSNTPIGNLFAQPHNECAAGSQGQHGHQNEPDTRVQNEIATFFQANRDTEGLYRAQDDGDVARPLGNFLAAHLAFFLQLGERFINDS
jgi:hypothetical protein